MKLLMTVALVLPLIFMAEHSAAVAQTDPPASGAQVTDGPDEIAQNNARNVFAQGDFELANEQARPQGWAYAPTPNIQWRSENGNHYLHLSRSNPNEGHIAGNKLILDPSWKKLKVLARMRVKNLKVGTEVWQNARLSLRYEDATGKTLDYAPPLEFKTDSPWIVRRIITVIPTGAHRLVIEPGVYGPAGELDIDDIVIVPNPPLDALPIREGFPAGKFETVGTNGDPVGWDLNDRKRIQWLEEDGNHFVRVSNELAHNFVMASGLFRLEPTWKTLKVRVRMRTTNLQIGPDPWDEPRLWLNFQDSEGKDIGPQPPSPNLKRDSDDWVLREVEATVPPGAVYLHLAPALLATRGMADFDDIQIEPVKPQ